MSAFFRRPSAFPSSVRTKSVSRSRPCLFRTSFGMTTCRSNACRTQHGAAFEVVSEVETFLLQGRDELFGRPALNDRLFLHMGIIGPDTVTWDGECCREIGNIAGIDRSHRVGRAIPRRHGLVLRNQNQESSESLVDEVIQGVDVPDRQSAPSGESVHALEVSDPFSDDTTDDLAPLDLRMGFHLAMQLRGDG